MKQYHFSGFRDFDRQKMIWNSKFKKFTTEYNLSAIDEIATEIEASELLIHKASHMINNSQPVTEISAMCKL